MRFLLEPQNVASSLGRIHIHLYVHTTHVQHPVILDALREKLIEKSGMYQNEMVFLHDKFGVLFNVSAVSRVLEWIYIELPPASGCDGP